MAATLLAALALALIDLSAAKITPAIQVTPGAPKIITSPSYPNSYPQESKTYNWTVTPSVGFHVTITPTDFDLAPGDYLGLADVGSTTPVPLEKCGNSTCQPVTTRNDLGMILVFHTQGKASAKGFNLTATATLNCAKLCAKPKNVSLGKVGDTAVVNSPNYAPSDKALYPSNCSCTWNVKAPSGSTIKVKVDSFKLKNGPDKVYIEDGSGKGANQLEMCTGLNCNDTQSTGNTLTVGFQSDAKPGLHGFHMTLTAVAGASAAGVPSLLFLLGAALAALRSVAA